MRMFSRTDEFRIHGFWAAYPMRHRKLPIASPPPTESALLLLVLLLLLLLLLFL